MLKLKSDAACINTAINILRRDRLLEGDSDGVKWHFDLASAFSYPTQDAPANGAAVVNLDETGSDGTVVEQAAESILYAGGGFDFTGVVKTGHYVNGPAAPLASIWASANQYFIVCLYLKLPTSANWNTDGTLHEMFRCAAVGTTYITGPELLTIAQASAGSPLSFRRQTAAGTATVTGLAPTAADYGSVVQLAYWRDATGCYARIKSANGTVLSSAAVGSNNTQNFSALTPKVGPRVFGTSADGTAMNAAHQNAAKWRLYRAFIENLAASGRDAATVLNDDYSRTIARGVFS